MSIEAGSFDNYHAQYEQMMANPLRRRVQEWFYERSRQLVQNQGWETIAERGNPSALLCGTGSSETSSAFTHFVRKQNPSTSITILDLQKYPVKTSRERLQKEKFSAVNFVQANALSLPFKPEQFDIIETDFFLQFFKPDQQITLIKEWHRVLKPQGIVVTRDYIQTDSNLVEKGLDYTRRTLLKKRLGAQAHTTHEDTIRNAFQDAKFDFVLAPMEAPLLNFKLPLAMHMAARKR